MKNEATLYGRPLTREQMRPPTNGKGMGWLGKENIR